MNSNQRKEVNKKVFPCHVTVDKILKSDLALLLHMLLLVVQTFENYYAIPQWGGQDSGEEPTKKKNQC